MMNIEALERATAAFRGILDEANELTKSDTGLKRLAERPGKIFCPAISIYAQLLEDHALLSMDEFDGLLKHEGVKQGSLAMSTAEAFWDIEDQWNLTLEMMDNQSNTSSVASYGIGHLAPLDTVLTTPDNPEQSTTLRDIIIENRPKSSAASKLHFVLLRHLS